MRLINIKGNEPCEVPAVQVCLDFLSKNGGDLPLGRNDIPNSDIYANVFEYTTRLSEDCIWEAHKEYADFHVALDGTEKIMVSNISNMNVGTYHTESDYQECTGEAEHIIEVNGTIGVLLMPEDGHMTAVAFNGAPAHVKKCVFKIPLKDF